MRTTEKYVFFWGNNDIYSNFYYSPFKHQGEVFKWSEQAIMYRKAKLFGSENIAKKILLAQTPKECKSLGRSKQIPFKQDIWDKEKENLYKEVLIDKFSNLLLQKQLLDTGNKQLVEASPFDKIWGIKMGENDPGVENPKNWKGQNLLGKVLEDVKVHYKQTK